MKTRLQTAMKALVLAAVTAAIYLPGLQYAPIYLANDEPKFALQARAIAATGRDLDGEFMPLYFSEAGYPAGRDPLIIYLTAVFLKRLPFSEATIRLPTALVGVVDVVLMFVLARRIFEREALAFAAAALLALTPAHFIHSRLGVNVLYPLPFAMMWLLLLLAFLERESLRTLFAAAAVLGVGVYSYVAATIMMPLYFVFTWLTLVRKKSAAVQYVVAVTGFAIPLLLLFAWHVRHPARYTELVSAYRIYDASRMNPLQGAKDLASYFSLGVRSGVYWDFFNPSFLFFSGDSSLINSTRRSGVFLWPVGLLLPLGVYRIVRFRPTWTNGLLLAGFVSAPLAAVLVAEVAIRRALLMVPFAVLIATGGLEWLFSAQQRLLRIAGVLLLGLIALQFRSFYLDYFTEYRDRSGVWFGGNIRAALEDLIERDRERPASAVYVSNRIPFVEAYWSFYAVKHGREDLLLRTMYYDPSRFTAQVSAADGLMVAPAHEEPTESLVRASGWRLLKVVTEPNGPASFMLYEK